MTHAKDIMSAPAYTVRADIAGRGGGGIAGAAVDERVVGVVGRCDMQRTLRPTDDAAQREAQHRLDVYADGQRRWRVHDMVATIDGQVDDDTERAVAEALVRTTAVVAAVQVTTPSSRARPRSTKFPACRTMATGQAAWPTDPAADR